MVFTLYLVQFIISVYILYITSDKFDNKNYGVMIINYLLIALIVCAVVIVLYEFCDTYQKGKQK